MRTYLTVVIAILAFLILCLIGSQAHAAEPIIPTRDNPEFTLRIIFDTPANIRRECVKLGAWGTSIKPRSEVGCTAFNLDTKVCTVYSPTPRELDDNPTAILGHEVLHCMSGRYHEE
jgi:hypothetical protein